MISIAITLGLLDSNTNQYLLLQTEIISHVLYAHCYDCQFNEI